MQLPERSVLVCANQRSGSTLLSRALAATGLVGRPEEYFLAVDEAVFPDFDCWEDSEFATPGMSRAEFVASVYEQGSTPNGVFSAKVMWICLEWMYPKFRSLPQFADLDDDAIFQAAFPSLQPILLTRRDHLAQAVSWARADHDGVWVVSDSEPARPAGTPRYDATHIKNLIGLIEHGERSWRALFGRLGVTPIEAVYEDVVADLGGSVARIVRDLGLGEIDPAAIQPATHRQADEVNASWVARYRSEAGLGYRQRAK